MSDFAGRNKEAVATNTLLAAAQAALGCGVGLLLAEKLGKGSRRNIAIALFSAGLISLVPLAGLLLAKRLKGPESARGVRRRLQSIREDAGFAPDAEVF